jgi:predicted DNA-binding protein (UPF0251 family)
MRKKVEILMEMPKKSRLFKPRTGKSISSITLEICSVAALNLCFILGLKTQKVEGWH